MTDKTLEKLKVAFCYGLNDVQACLFAEINPATLYNYQKKHPEFLELKHALQENPVRYATQVLFDNLDGKPDLALKVLERLSKKYKPNQEITAKVESFESILARIEKEGGLDEKSEDEGGAVEWIIMTHIKGRCLKI